MWSLFLLYVCVCVCWFYQASGVDAPVLRLRPFGAGVSANRPASRVAGAADAAAANTPQQMAAALGVSFPPPLPPSLPLLP